MNRQDLEKKIHPITSDLMGKKGYICLVDIFIGLGYLSEKDVELWRMKKIPYLEKKIMVGLGKISFIAKTVTNNCRNGGLKASTTSYKSWGKGAKKDLRFTKSGDKSYELMYKTHWLKIPKKSMTN